MQYTIPVDLFIEANSAFEAYSIVVGKLKNLHPDIDWSSHDVWFDENSSPIDSFKITEEFYY
jgi:hypothetical protein